MFELDTLKQATPKHLRSYITNEFVERFNNITDDEKIAEEYRENLIGYTDVLANGKYKISDYFNAVKFVTMRALGRNLTEAYVATFPDRYESLKSRGEEDVSSYASMYNKNKLVVAIMEQCMVPMHIINQDKHQKALNELFKLGINDKVAPMTRVKALDSFLNYTKAPEDKNLNIEIGVSASDSMQELISTMRDYTALQKQDIVSGKKSSKEVIEATIINARTIEDE